MTGRSPRTRKPRARVHRIDTAAELQALASPARIEFLVGLQALQPCTMAELGEHIGRLPASLYYHLRKLEEVGLVVEDHRRETRHGSEAVYRMRSQEVHIDPAQRHGENLEALKKIGTGIFRLAMRLHAAAVGEKPARPALRRKHVLRQRTLRLDAQGLERLNASIAELMETLDEQAGDSDDFYTLTLHLAPNPVRGRPGSKRG